MQDQHRRRALARDMLGNTPQHLALETRLPRTIRSTWRSWTTSRMHCAGTLWRDDPRRDIDSWNKHMRGASHVSQDKRPVSQLSHKKGYRDPSFPYAGRGALGESLNCDTPASHLALHSYALLLLVWPETPPRTREHSLRERELAIHLLPFLGDTVDTILHRVPTRARVLICADHHRHRPRPGPGQSEGVRSGSR